MDTDFRGAVLSVTLDDFPPEDVRSVAIHNKF